MDPSGAVLFLYQIGSSGEADEELDTLQIAGLLVIAALTSLSCRSGGYSGTSTVYVRVGYCGYGPGWGDGWGGGYYAPPPVSRPTAHPGRSGPGAGLEGLGARGSGVNGVRTNLPKFLRSWM